MATRPKSRSSTEIEVEYCIRTCNHLITSLKLRHIPPIQRMGDISVSILIEIYCALVGVNYSKEFIPSGNPNQDANRMLLALKDRFGTDKFKALDAAAIAQGNFTQIRFVLETFLLIFNYQKGAKSERSLNRSESNNHLTAQTDSDLSLRRVESFYAPSSDASSSRQFSEEDSEQPSSSYISGDQSTLQNIRINVYDTDADLDATDSDLDASAIPNMTGLMPPSQLTFHSSMTMPKTARPLSDPANTEHPSEDSLDSKDCDELLEKVIYTRKKLHGMLSETLKSLDEDIDYLKKTKCVKTCQPKPRKPSGPDYTWLLPVDKRFPKYDRGVIIPTCVPLKKTLKLQAERKSRAIMMQQMKAQEAQRSKNAVNANRKSGATQPQSET